jgi:hypothetical protein
MAMLLSANRCTMSSGRSTVSRRVQKIWLYRLVMVGLYTSKYSGGSPGYSRNDLGNLVTSPPGVPDRLYAPFMLW